MTTNHRLRKLIKKKTLQVTTTFRTNFYIKIDTDLAAHYRPLDQNYINKMYVNGKEISQ